MEETAHNDCEPDDDTVQKDCQQICRICYCGPEDEPLIAPCQCLGSVEFVHQTCLLAWLRHRSRRCELCNYKYRLVKTIVPRHERRSPRITAWQMMALIKAILVLDWFHFLETVFLCFSLCVVNHLNSMDLLYQVALIGTIEIFYYGVNLINCYFMLYYNQWTLLNLNIVVLNHSDSTESQKETLMFCIVDKYAGFLSGNRRLMEIIQGLEDHHLA